MSLSTGKNSDDRQRPVGSGDCINPPGGSAPHRGPLPVGTTSHHTQGSNSPRQEPSGFSTGEQPGYTSRRQTKAHPTHPASTALPPHLPTSYSRQQHGRHASYQSHPLQARQLQVAQHTGRGNRPHSTHFADQPYPSRSLPPPQPDGGFARGRGGHPPLHQGGRLSRDAGPAPPVGNLSRRDHRPQRPGQSNNWGRGSELMARQEALLDSLCTMVLSEAEVDRDDIAEKEAFRVSVESICRDVVSRYERDNGAVDFPSHTVQLKCFGSLSSGFATKASDMDLGLLSPASRVQPDAPGSPIPRLVEKALLDAGFGARLLTRTRIPIIKVCERPPPQLLSDLRNEREKWESELDMETVPSRVDGHGREDPHATPVGSSHVPTDTDVTAPDAAHPDATSASIQHPVDSPNCSENPDSQDHAFSSEGVADRVSLAQGESQSLLDYYGSAKRILRQLQGHDLTISSCQKFSKEDCQKLSAVCRAFLAGIRDDSLRERLLNYPSLQLPFASEPQHLRTLVGVYTQVEGEAMLMKWESCPAQERSEEQQRFVISAVKYWKVLQERRVFGFSSIQYAKELQTALERLRRLASVRLVILEQGPYEPASHYSARAMRLFSELVPTVPKSQADLGAEIRLRYIAGIYHRDIRTAVEAFVQSSVSSGPLPFVAVARRHKSLQLAREFERALGKNMYPEGIKEAVGRYIGHLRGDMKRVHLGGSRQDWVIPATGISSEDLSIVHQLQNPSTLAPNQPRDPYHDRLEFPKSGAGVQCDINFSAHLALHNTLLLRCYSHTDPRVRPMVLFIKHWAKVRGINTPYRGTLSSYGYVLMVLHFLVNVAQPFVSPNLQKLAPLPPPTLSPDQLEQQSFTCKGRDVGFWRNEQEITQLARDGRLNQNADSVGRLLCAFYEYYAHGGSMSTLPGKGFDWGREVLSLRTMGGLLTKHQKGWTGAKTVTIVEQVPTEAGVRALPEGGKAEPAGHNLSRPLAEAGSTPAVGHRDSQSGPDRPVAPAATHKSQEIKEVRHRYLFAIEDPFELDHNVARTVTHSGIVSIRDEFRRAWRIIQNVGYGRQDEDLLTAPSAEGTGEGEESFAALLSDIHGTDLDKSLS